VPCVDGSRLASQNFTSHRWSVQPCVRPVSAVRMTAGHNALRGSGPGQKPAFDDALARVGCPDRRIDRLCITCCSPFSDAVGRRSRAEAYGSCHCGPRTYPRGVDACLRPGRPSPLDQTRLPTLNLAVPQRRFGPKSTFPADFASSFCVAWDCVEAHVCANKLGPTPKVRRFLKGREPLRRIHSWN
jgi:hypothetical protein